MEDYSRELINRVLGYELPLNAAAYVWFKNEDEFEEMKKASLEGAIGVIAEIMHDKSAPAPARLKAAELALKVSKAFDKKDEGKKPESSAFSDAEIESMKAQGIDVTPFLKEVK